jgi:hypothetical protein
MQMQHPMSRLLLAALLLVAGVFASRGAAAQAQATPAPAASPAPDPCGGEARLLATLNRPTIGFSTCAVAKGTIVIEPGYQNSTVTGIGAGNAVQYPQALTRIGVADRFEFDVVTPNYMRVSSGGAYTQGYSDSGLGFKYEFAPKTKFNYGIDGIVTVASGTNGFSGGAPGYTANLDVAYALSPAMALGSTLAFQSLSGFTAGGSRSRYGAFAPSAVVTAQLPGFFQLYAEYVYTSQIGPGMGSRSTVDYGVQKLLGRNLEVDLELGQALNTIGGARLRYIGAGLGIQL